MGLWGRVIRIEEHKEGTTTYCRRPENVLSDDCDWQNINRLRGVWNKAKVSCA